jgi:hypothetical protein
MLTLLREARGALGLGVGSAETGEAARLAGADQGRERGDSGHPGETAIRLHRRRPLARIVRPPAAVVEDIL